VTPGPRPGSTWVAAALRWALAGGATAGAPVPPPPEVARDAVAAAARHRVAGVLAPEAEQLGLPSPAALALRRVASRDAMAAMAVVGTTTGALATIERQGVRCLAVKGAAMAAVQGRPLVARGAGDVDLWVHPRDHAAAAVALQADGWDLRPLSIVPDVGPTPWRRRLASWGASACTLERGEAPPVDLHWRLAPSAASLPLGFDAAFARSVAVPGLGATARTLGPADALAHAANHASRHCWQGLRSVVDVTLLARAVDGDELGRLAADVPDVGLALAVAARLAPDLAPSVPAGTRRRRLADEAWGECLAGRLPTLRHSDARGWARLRLVGAKASWHVRSAPSAGAAVGAAARSVLPRTFLLDPAPAPEALARYAGRLVRR
jgi:hypothetical protein